MAAIDFTSISVTPNPYTSTINVSWTGLWFQSGLEWGCSIRFFLAMSADNATWTVLNGSNAPIEVYTRAISGTTTITPPAHVPNGYYLRVSACGAAHNNRIPPAWTISAYRYAYTQKIAYSACGPPTACAVNTVISEGNVTLSWSGATAGTANPISNYEVQYSDSADGVNWGGWAALTTVASTASTASVAVSPHGTRGYYRRFQVRTWGSAGASYYSGWKVSTNTLRRNTLPTAPTTFTAAPATYTTENITLAWSGAVAGTSAIKQYVIQKAESTDNVTWGAWTAVQTVVSSATSGSLVVSPTRTLDMYTLYRICAQDTLNCLSAYRNSNSVYSLALPFAPTIVVPKASAATYNRNPKVLIQTVAPPGGRAQTVFARGTDGVTYNSVDHPGRFSVSGTSTGAVKTVFTNLDTVAGSFTASVHCTTAAAGPAATRAFSVAASPFAETISAGTPVKAAHMITMQAAVNTIRNYYGLAAYMWSYSITPGKTSIAYWPYHVKELREAIQQIVDLLATYGGAPKISWLAMGKGRPRADVMNQLQTVILGL